MSAVASGTFVVEIVPATPELDGAINRFTLRKSFTGDLEGSGSGLMLSGGDPASGSAGYVAIEVVRGTLQGRSGQFALMQLGRMHGGDHELRYDIVPGSGTDELAGITGALALEIEADGTHHFTLTYDV